MRSAALIIGLMVAVGAVVFVKTHKGHSSTGRVPSSKARSPSPPEPLFRVVGDSIVIPEADDRPASVPQELLRLACGDFLSPVHVYRERVGIRPTPTVSKPITIPSGASELVVLARGQAVEDIFPRFTIELRPADGSSEKIYSGCIQSHSLQEITCPIPQRYVGKRVQIALQMENYYALHDTSYACFSYLAVR